MAIDRPGIDVIRNARFPSAWAWRGYDKVEVEKFLDELADWLETEDGRSSVEGGNRETTAGIVAELEARIEELEKEASKSRRRERRLLEELKDARAKLKARSSRRAATSSRAKTGKTTGSTRAVRKPGSTGSTRAVPKQTTGSTRAAGRTPSRRRKRVASPAETKPREGAVDVNKVDFDDLRAMDLSITQAALLIALRDLRGGFKSLDELEDVQGLSKTGVDKLRAGLYVGPRT